MQSIVEANIADVEVVAVISNRRDAAGLNWAKQRGLTTAVLDHKQFSTREEYDAELAGLIDTFSPDLVVLAGFMRILTASFCHHYVGRLINIHPSLLPAFTGLDTHQRAIDSGCRVAGCTVHFVTPDLDCGPIIAQGCVPVLDNDDAHTLAARVLSVEHQILPQVVADFAANRLKIRGNRVIITQQHSAKITQSFIY